MAYWTDDATSRTSTLGTESICARKTGTTETADIVLDIPAARLTEVGIRVEFRTAIRTITICASHFSTVFKKHYGMTPTEYIERGEKGEE